VWARPLVACVAVYLRSLFFMVVMGVRAARALHAKLLTSVLAAPTSFFETTPSGRILNRFTADTETLDNASLQTLQQWFNCIFPIFTTIVLVSIVLYWSLLWLLPLGALYVLLYRHSVSATRDIQRLEAVSKSPIFSHFSEALGGLTTIRAFGATRRFAAESIRLVDVNTRCLYSQYLLTSWVSLFLDLMAASVIFVSAALPVLGVQLGQTVSASLAGVAISSSLELSQFLKHATKMTLEVNKVFAGIERIVEYIQRVPHEAAAGELPPSKWPTTGQIAVNDLSIRYRPELPLALRSVSVTIPAKAKVGIVGRTGSGKSTFLAALWRLVEPQGYKPSVPSGAILIDGVDTSSLHLSSFRSRLAIIPQDPVLFNDTLRYNLDPFGERTDNELHAVLDLVQMAATVRELPDGLRHQVAEGGANFSVGQRQLICLARATLRRSALLALDEATASIDNETDATLQRAIRSMFAECTVLTIAHRLHTIMDSTAVMLFDQGALAEYDAPEVLLADPASRFSALIDETGSAAQHLRGLALSAASERSSTARASAVLPPEPATPAVLAKVAQ